MDYLETLYVNGVLIEHGNIQAITEVRMCADAIARTRFVRVKQ